ncbi:MAG: site-specific integrase [Holophagales bacterium]|nr:site-specific integrase [Holophagales bacterium]
MPLKLVKRKGSPFWYVRGTFLGETVYESTEETCKKQAQRHIEPTKEDIRQRHFSGDAAVATFDDAADLYLEAGGEDTYLPPIRKEIGHLLLSELRQSELNALATTLYPEAAPSTRNRQVYTPFIACWKEASRNDLCPVVEWKRPKGHNKSKPVRWLWPHEAEAVLNAAPDHSRAAFVFMLGQGVRESEAARLDFKDVDLQGAQAWVWEGKSKEPRRLELQPRVVVEIANLEHRAGFVFRTRNGGPHTIRKKGGGIFKAAISNACRKASVDGFGAHVFRHTWATWAYSVTQDILWIRDQGGWASTELLERYAKLAPRGLTEELSRFGWNPGRASDAHLIRRRKNV